MPVDELLGNALVHSLKLAAFAFVIVVPLAILGGVIAALKRDRPTDRVDHVGGHLADRDPRVRHRASSSSSSSHSGPTCCRSARNAPDGSGFFTQLKYLTLPALTLVILLFGYIARITRAGTIEALDSDYTRTAVLKGLPQRTVVRRHVLRNSLLPTIAVVATQTGYLIGGLVVIERLFNYPGIGRLDIHRGDAERLPGAAEQRPRRRDHLPHRNAAGGPVLLASQPPHPVREQRMTTIDDPTTPITIPHGDEARIARRERIRLLLRSPAFILGCVLLGIWVICAIFGELIAPQDPLRRGSAERPRRRRAASTCSAPIASAATCSRASS